MIAMNKNKSRVLLVFGEDGSNEQVKDQYPNLLKLKTERGRFRFLDTSPKTSKTRVHAVFNSSVLEALSQFDTTGAQRKHQWRNEGHARNWLAQLCQLPLVLCLSQ